MNEITRDYVLEDRHLRTLNLAAVAWDRLEVIREAITREGVTVTDRFEQTKAHPLLSEERAQMRTFVAMIRELGLDLDSTEPPRKPTRGGR